ncbi:OmpA family protein [Sinorhizobium mexicanum]|uniref:OmpA family protein n=1 Tax=Sinorhizobium mexicanum TaxID=375549 RepID=A0A859QKG2_9HYPH|nr:OmpA family protein [Sinorhizobium mexicanum]MBP1882175.1 outer membrane protein OmpA-like peptidoglycan-associated protein [Sinorhizobium mexicanum]QLL61897.1 OmpA family protein [Sinorhizobium mexicanum]
MSIRSRLFATVALPVFAATFAVQPALAESLMAPFEVAQEGADQPSPEDLLLLKKRRKQAEQGQAEEQQPAAGEEQAPRRKKRQQQVEEQQPAAEEAAPQQAEEPQAPRRKKRQQQAEEQQPAAEEAAPQQAEEQQAPRRKKRQQQVEEQQPAAEEAAPRQAEEQPAPKRKKRQQQAEEQQPAAEEGAPKQAEEQQAPARKKRQQQAEEQQPATEEGTPQRAEEQQTPRKKRQQAEEQQPATEEGTPKQAEEQQVPRKKRQQQAEEQRQTEQPADQAGEGRQPVPGAEAPATAEQGTGEQPRARPAPEVVDKRTEEEKVKIAKDPAATDDTVVLPVENGAAILDSDKDADNVGGNRAREARRKQREELRAKAESVAPPTDDASSQAEISTEARQQFPKRIEANLKEEGQRIEEAPAFAVPQTTNIVNNTVINNTTVNNTTVNNNTNEVTEVQVVEEVEDRVILGVGDRIFVRGDDRPRLRRDSEETFYDQLPRDRVRETIVRPGGYRIVTIYNRYGDIVQRSRIDGDGNEYLMVYAPEYDEDDNRPAIVDVGYDLPPMRLTIPVEDYIVDVADDPDRDYYEFLSEPPVEQVERVYTIDEVRNSARLRDKVRRIDLDTIHFETGSAEVSMTQAKTLRGVADAMSKVLEKDPGETFFIEGHTDAVGSDRDNLVLSDQRAESVAVLLSEAYGIPAENLVTQGYGERFLKVRTPDAEEENRRVTIRRVTPLVRPVAQR